jgi:cephalosporin hydroxylase
MNKFEKEKIDRIKKNENNVALFDSAKSFFLETVISNYSYNFSALGLPIIQYPQDTVAMQEIIWKVRPDLIIETGIAHGGSLIMNASMLALLDICEAIELAGNGEKMINPKKSKRKVIGVDIDIRSHNKKVIERHPMASRIHMIQGSSIDPLIIEEVKKLANDYKCIIVCLDSNHTHSHVLEELKAYAPLISVGSYCIVFDTVIENLPHKFFHDRPWGPGNSPKTAVYEYLKDHPNFKIDKDIQSKLLMTVALDGYIKRIS